MKALLIEYLANKQRRGFSPICLICGEQRLGKTMLAFKMAWELKKYKFDPRKHYFTSVKEFAMAYFKNDNTVLIYDEIGDELDPFRAMDNLNRAFSKIIQTQAFHRNILFAILPYAIDFTKGHRKYVKVVVEVIKRGRYKMYSTYTWAANLNETKIRLTHLETMTGVPLPPYHLEDYYKTKVEKVTKDEIMNRQLVKLGLIPKEESSLPQKVQEYHSVKPETPSLTTEQILAQIERVATESQA